MVRAYLANLDRPEGGGFHCLGMSRWASRAPFRRPKGSKFHSLVRSVQLPRVVSNLHLRPEVGAVTEQFAKSNSNSSVGFFSLKCHRAVGEKCRAVVPFRPCPGLKGLLHLEMGTSLVPSGGRIIQRLLWLPRSEDDPAHEHVVDQHRDQGYGNFGKRQC